MTTHLRMDESTTRTIQNRTESSSNIEVAYEEMIPTEASHMDRYNVEDQTVWRLINLIGKCIMTWSLDFETTYFNKR